MGYSDYDRIEIPFGRLDVRVPDHEAALGTVRATKNLCSLGTTGKPYYSPVETPERRGDIDDIIGLCRHTRQRSGELSGGLPGTHPFAAWTGYFEITSDNAQITSSNDNLPFRLENAPSDFWMDVASDGRDIRVTTSDGETELAREVVSLSKAAQTGGLHIDTTGISTSVNTVYRIYYGNPAATEPLPEATYGRWAVWNSDYELVSHNGGITDATINGNDGTNNGTVVGTEQGLSGLGRKYDGVDDNVSTGIVSVTVPFTLQAYVRPERSANEMILSNFDTSGSEDCFLRNSSGTWQFLTDSPANDIVAGAVALNTFAMIAGVQTTAGGGGKELFLDGVSQGTNTGGAANFNTGKDFRTGDDPGAPREPFLGHIEEVRISKVARTAAWQLTEVKAIEDVGFWAVSVASSTSALISGLERLVALRAADIRVVETFSAEFDDKVVYTFTASDTSRQFQCGPVAESLFMAVVEGDGYGFPEELLELRDDTVRPMHVPELPYISVATAVEASGNGLDGGLYFYRYAFELQDGTIIGAECPHFIVVPIDANVYKLTFTVDSYRDGALPALWTEVIKNIAIFLTPGIVGSGSAGTDQDRWMLDPYHLITHIDLAATSTVVFADETAQIGGYPLYEEDILTFHNILAGAAYGYNKRLLLGDVSFDYGLPQAWQNVSSINRSDAPPTGVNQVRLGVTIRTDTGHFERIGPPATLTTLNPILFLSFGVFYPDRRATEISAYISTDTGATWYKSATFTLRPAANNNVAFAFPTSFNGNTNTGSMNVPATVNAVHDRDVNRVMVSRTFQPRALLARELYSTGAGPEDGVVGFATNALPASAGQYGDFPVLMLCRESVWYGRLGTKSFFQEIAPVSAERGCVGRYAFTNLDNVVAFASKDGIWLIRSQLDLLPISEPITTGNIEGDLFGCLDFDTALAYHNDRTRGRRELWVAAGTLVFTWSTRYDQWNILERARRAFVRLNNILYGAQKFVEGNTLGITAAEDGYLFHEHALRDVIAIYLRSSRLTFQEFGGLGLIKRLKRAWIRQDKQLNTLAWRITENDPTGALVVIAEGSVAHGGLDTTYLDAGFAYEPYIEVFGGGSPGQKIEGFGFDYKVMYPHRAPAAMPNTGNNQFGGLSISGTVWDCAIGFTLDEIPPLPGVCDIVAVNLGAFGAPSVCVGDEITLA